MTICPKQSYQNTYKYITLCVCKLSCIVQKHEYLADTDDLFYLSLEEFQLSFK